MVILIIITGIYSIVYLVSIVITLIVNGGLPFEEHSLSEIAGILFIFSAGILTGGVYLSYFYPEVRERIHGSKISSTPTSLEVLLYISTEDEIKIIESIQSLAPKAYKFEIARKSGLSRMKVHRILMRMSERGIVRIVKDGRYSQIYLTDWVK